MLTSSADPLKKLRQTKNINDNRKLTSRLRREISIKNSSSVEDYYHGGVPVSVPFRWESEPGTPKVRFRESPLPPLTPPPSYSYSTSPKSPIRKNPKLNLLATIFPKRAVIRKTNLPSSPASSYSSSSSSWSSYSVPSSPARPSNFRGRYEMSSPRLSCDSRAEEEEEQHEYESALCLARAANTKSKGCYAYLFKLLLRDSQ